jgi:hypothetical protein
MLWWHLEILVPIAHAAMSRLSSGFPGTIAGPESPPLVQASRGIEAQAALGLPDSVLWHSKH